MTNEKYVPGSDPDRESDVPNVSGMSPKANVEIEEAAQRRVAQDREWLLARELNNPRGNSRQLLESLGFEIVGQDGDLFYLVRPPAGWTKKTEGYWTTVYDEGGKERLTQFYKGAWYDQRAFLNISNKGEANG